MMPMYVDPQVSLTLAVPSSSRKQPLRPTTHRSLPPKATRSAALPVVPSPGIHGASPLAPAEQSPLAGSTPLKASRSKYVRAASRASRKRYAPNRATGSLLRRHSTAAVARTGRSFRLGAQLHDRVGAKAGDQVRLDVGVWRRGGRSERAVLDPGRAIVVGRRHPAAVRQADRLHEVPVVIIGRDRAFDDLQLRPGREQRIELH